MEERNALIKHADIAIEGHGIWTSFLQMEWGAATTQGYGGFDLRGEAMFQWVSEVCRIAGVDNWGKVAGNHVRIRHTHARIEAIGHLTEERWLDFHAFLERSRSDA